MLKLNETSEKLKQQVTKKLIKFFKKRITNKTGKIRDNRNVESFVVSLNQKKILIFFDSSFKISDLKGN